MRWLLAVAVAAAVPGCASVAERPETLSMRYVEASAEGHGPTDPVWIVVEVSHALPEAVPLDPDDFSLRDADGRTYELFSGYVLREGGARATLPVDAPPGVDLEVHLQGYLVGATPPEPPLTVRWTQGVDRASAGVPWPPT